MSGISNSLKYLIQLGLSFSPKLPNALVAMCLSLSTIGTYLFIGRTLLMAINLLASKLTFSDASDHCFYVWTTLTYPASDLE